MKEKNLHLKFAIEVIYCRYKYKYWRAHKREHQRFGACSLQCQIEAFLKYKRHLAMNTLISLFKTPLHNECISKETKPVPMFYFKRISKVMMGNVKGKDPDSWPEVSIHICFPVLHIRHWMCFKQQTSLSFWI